MASSSRNDRARPGPSEASAGQLRVQLGGRQRGGASGRGGWRILPEPELHFGRQVVVPDLAGWRLERLPRLPAAPYVELAPDWLCEVLSPSTQQFDREKKLRVYAAAGVRHVWLVDPLARSLEVLRRAESTWTRVAHHEGRDVAQADPFAEINLPLPRLWDEDWM